MLNRLFYTIGLLSILSFIRDLGTGEMGGVLLSISAISAYLLCLWAPGFCRFWHLFQFSLPKKLRDEVYTPGHNELLADYIETRQFCSPAGQHWLMLCFVLRTSLLIIDCWRVWGMQKSVQFIVNSTWLQIKK